MKRKDLVTTLELVKPALADNNMIPVFQCFMFDKNTVTATNDQIAIIGGCDVQDAFAVNGNILLSLLQNSKAEDVSFTLDRQEVHVKAGRSTFKLPYMPKTDFLFSPPKMDAGQPLTPEFVEGLQACLLTSSKDNTQPALMGVCLSKGSTLYSCDGDAVTRYKLPNTVNSTEPDRMLPNVFCEAVVTICTAVDSAEGTFAINDEWVEVITDIYVLYGRLIKVDKPIDYEDLIKKTLRGQKPPFQDVPNTLDGALSRARVIADPESAKTMLTIEGDRLRLFTETHMGVVRDNVQFKAVPEVKANVSAELVQRAIRLCDQMAVLDNCTVYRRNQHLFQLLSNMG